MTNTATPAQLPAFRIIGLHIRTQPATAAADIGALWPRWFGSDTAAISALDDALYCAYHQYDSDYRGAYSVTLGKKVAADAPVPAGFAELLIPAQDYACYPAPGEMPQAIVQVWQHIWQNDANLPRRYQVDFDVYPAAATPAVYIGLRT
ncbi:GyrI-like domain-containing protein [Paralysiella testudinis]|uniref:Effector binding domain-containing protein n=1 Tax=Paralysiella testudinis TaxID=2809020 RepID=A0A892ZDE1_9NEIS|nr:effector binding domain-containing protein [Paralysiella testudinis]QRQ81345.1 effector binding domain-containing protein [Paralysiella testudinis]